MEAVSIIHCADIHLGMELGGIGRKSTARKSEIKVSFQNIIERCEKQGTDLLLIAGDVFDAVNCKGEDVRDIIASLSRLTHTRVFIAPGNHDYYAEGCVYDSNRYEWPENTYIFKAGFETVVIDELKTCVSGAAFRSAHVESSLLVGHHGMDLVADDPERKDYLQIGVLHGDVGTTGNYNPMTEEDIRLSSFDYLALGHIHKQSPVLYAGETAYAYSGCPEGHGFDELGLKGIYEGTVEKGKVNLEYVNLCKRRYEEVNVDISSANQRDDIKDIIKNKLDNLYGSDYAENLYKINLTGNVNADLVDIAYIKAQLGDIYFIKIRDKSEPIIDMEAVIKAGGLKGAFVLKMKSVIDKFTADGDEESAAHYRKALAVGMRAFDREVGYSNDNQ
mgnify:CR=1 FL=1